MPMNFISGLTDVFIPIRVVPVEQPRSYTQVPGWAWSAAISDIMRWISP